VTGFVEGKVKAEKLWPVRFISSEEKWVGTCATCRKQTVAEKESARGATNQEDSWR